VPESRQCVIQAQNKPPAWKSVREKHFPKGIQTAGITQTKPWDSTIGDTVCFWNRIQSKGILEKIPTGFKEVSAKGRTEQW